MERLKGEKVVVAGCMPEIDIGKIKKIDEKFVVLGPKFVDKILDAVEGESFVGDRKIDKSCLAKEPVDDVYTLEICEGCNNKCFYCAAKIARGEIFSFDEGKIVEELREAVKKFKVIHITAQDTAAYGLDKDKKSKLPELIEKIVEVDGDFRIRIGMMNISNVLPVLDELVDIYKNDKVIRFLHIPVQSGSDKVLKEMNRKYEVKDFIKIGETFRKEIPDIRIATDVIVGYPTETEDDFEESVKLLKKIKPEVLNVSMFAPRPGTKAEKMKQLKSEIVKERSKRMDEI